MTFEGIVPVLYSADLAMSLAYYTGQLAFDDSWTWDEPATFGGVSKDCVRLFFCLNGQGAPGTWLAVNVDNVDDYYETVRERVLKYCRHRPIKNGSCGKCWYKTRTGTSYGLDTALNSVAFSSCNPLLPAAITAHHSGHRLVLFSG